MLLKKSVIILVIIEIHLIRGDLIFIIWYLFNDFHRLSILVQLDISFKLCRSRVWITMVHFDNLYFIFLKIIVDFFYHTNIWLFTYSLSSIFLILAHVIGQFLLLKYNFLYLETHIIVTQIERWNREGTWSVNASTATAIGNRYVHIIRIN